MRRGILVLAGALLGSCALGIAPARAANIVGVDLVNTGPTPALGRLDFTVRLDKSHANPFDPSQIEIVMDVERLGLSKVEHVRGFWFQDFDATFDGSTETLTAKGDAEFRVRYRPRVGGMYQFTVHATDADGTDDAKPVSLQINSATGEITGFVGIDPADGARLVRGDEPWAPFGMNVDWVDAGGTARFDQYFGKLQDAGLDWTRIWMSLFDATALEGKAGGDGGAYCGLNCYNLKAAWRVDRILTLAGQHGIALQLCLQQHSQFETGQWSSWPDNPWNAANGGPLAKSMEFFTNTEVVAGFDARLKYLVARYADSPALMAWELWNEVDLITGYSPGVASAWMRARSAVLKSLDPYAHLVTTSYAIPGVEGTDQDWADPAYDLVQLHSYMSSYWDVLPMAAQHLRTFGKPVIAGEWGIDSQGQLMLADTTGIELVNANLLAPLLGFTGGAMSWWWDGWILENDLWPRVGHVAAVVRALGVDRATGFPGDATVDAATGLALTAALTATGEVVWLHDPGSEWDAAADWVPGDHQGVKVWFGAGMACPGSVAPGTGSSVDVAAMDPWTGAWMGSGSLQAETDGVRFVWVPTFQRDVVLSVKCPPMATPEPSDEFVAEAVVEAAAPEVSQDLPLADATEPEVIPSSSGGGCSARF